MALSYRRKLIIVLLVFYWPALFILTHIPIWSLVRKAGVSDKSLHFLAYLILVFLLWFAISPDKKVNWRRATVWWILFVVVWYGAADELLQSYAVGRSSDIMDFAANLVGTLTGLILFSFFTFWPACLLVTATTIFGLTNLARANPADLLPVTNTAFHFFAYGFFTILWIQYMHFFLSLKAPKPKWLIVALTLPMGFLLAVKLSSVVLGKNFAVRDVIIAVVGIAAVVVTIYVIALFHQHFTQKLSPGNG